MERFVERTLLYDFYGELLTKRQQEIYSSVVLDDYSLSEVALDQGVSRQSIHDMIRRCDGILKRYEEKLHLVEKFVSIRDQVRQIDRIAREQGLDEISKICGEIAGEL
ncbi:MAG: YlxM family DNA-binding protein [Blautia sp.]|nr:YlxM family DNA-binding protein [Blautia sp.]